MEKSCKIESMENRTHGSPSWRSIIWRCLLCFLTPGGVPATTTEAFCNSWKIHGKSIHGKSLGNRMGKPWENKGKLYGNPWIIKTEKRKCFRGTPWVPMGAHGDPWAPMRNHGFPWVPMGSHGFPWVPMGSHGSHGFPWDPRGPHGSSSLGPVLWT